MPVKRFEETLQYFMSHKFRHRTTSIYGIRSCSVGFGAAAGPRFY
jgi:hypothetical protein